MAILYLPSGNMLKFPLKDYIFKVQQPVCNLIILYRLNCWLMSNDIYYL
jgi:hypothetical protein